MNLKMHMYVAILLGNQPQKHTIKKEGNSAVPVSGCMGNFMSVSDQLNNVQPTTNIINEIFPNGQIIRSTMEEKLDLPMLPNTATQAHILPNIKHSLVSIG